MAAAPRAALPLPGFALGPSAVLQLGAVTLGVAGAAVAFGLVGRCRLPVSKPMLKAPTVSALETIISETAFNVCLQFQLALLRLGWSRRADGAEGAVCEGWRAARSGVDIRCGRVRQRVRARQDEGERGRSLHSFTFQLNVSAFCGIGGALSVFLRRDFASVSENPGGVGGLKGVFRVRYGSG